MIENPGISKFYGAYGDGMRVEKGVKNENTLG